MDLVLKNQVKNYFNERVATAKIDNELRHALIHRPKDFPKVENFIENLCVQFVKADEICRGRGLTLKMTTIQTTVYDMTDFFLNLIETENKRMVESQHEKWAREAKAEQIRQAEDFLAGGTDNEYSQELGLINEGETKVKEFKEDGKGAKA